MPAAVVYLVLWQWAQTFARILQTLVDGESLGGGLYGPNVERAYWYMLASVVMLALALRMVLGASGADAGTAWRTRVAAAGSVVALSAASVLSIVARMPPAYVRALGQPIRRCHISRWWRCS